MAYLLDTNVLSELRRPRPHPNVLSFFSAQPMDALFVSAVTIAEIRFGIEKSDNPTLRADLRTWLINKLRPMFADRILAVTEDVLVTWRLLAEEGRKSGLSFSLPDLLIAATAAHHGLVVVTRDLRPFRAALVPAIDPWVPTPPD